MANEPKKRKSVYNPEANKRWSEKNPERRRYLSMRSSAKSFIRNYATEDDMQDMEALMTERRKQDKTEVRSNE